MARAKKTKTDKRTIRARQRRWIIHYLTSSDLTFEVVHPVITELFNERQAILADYVRTEGSTDWVWLEEALSGTMDGFEYFAELYRRSERLDPYEPSDSEWFDRQEHYAAYIACFAIALSIIQTIYPEVRGPAWFIHYLPLIQNRKFVPTDIAEIARDMFLSGRDQEAITLLADIRTGPFMYWAPGFYQDVDAYPPRRNRILPTLPDNTSFGVIAPGEHGEDGLTIDEAIGVAMRYYAQTDMPAIVRVNVIEGESQWDGRIVFAISPNEEDIVLLEEDNR